MKKNTIRLLCAGIALLCMSAAADPLDSVVKIFTVYSSPIYSLPWMDIPHEGSGSGCVIKGKRILTNAHVVSDQIMVLVRKQSSPDKFKARVIAVAHDCDLALLEVEDESFFDDLAPLDIMTDLPSLQDPVFVLGYPAGGESNTNCRDFDSYPFDDQALIPAAYSCRKASIGSNRAAFRAGK